MPARPRRLWGGGPSGSQQVAVTRGGGGWRSVWGWRWVSDWFPSKQYLFLSAADLSREASITPRRVRTD